MALRAGHGTGAGMPRVEVLPADEQPVDARQESPSDRGHAGRFAPGNSLARAGGQATAGKTRLASRLGLSGHPSGAAWAARARMKSSARRGRSLLGDWSRSLGRTSIGGFSGNGTGRRLRQRRPSPTRNDR